MEKEYREKYEATFYSDLVYKKICFVDKNTGKKFSIFSIFYSKIKYYKWRIVDFIKYIINYARQFDN